MYLSKCPACESTEFADYLNHPYDADGHDWSSFSITRCNQCGTGWTTPLPSVEAIVPLYSQGIYEKHGGRGRIILDRLLNKLQNQRLNEIARIVEEKSSLLDIGCGKGRFLRMAVAHGWEAYGQDTSSTQTFVAGKMSAGVQVVNRPLSDLGFADGRFRAITAWHTVEHIPKLDETFQTIRQLLEPQGIFAFEVPNFSSWQSRIGAQLWFQLDAPRHIWHFTPGGLRALLNRHGFEVVRTSTLSLELGPFGMLQSILNRTGLPPQWLFRYLKRSLPMQKTRLLFGTITAAAMMSGPAIVLEGASVLFGAGGVIRILARAKTYR
jgi:SAM-dependent methyltransferase